MIRRIALFGLSLLVSATALGEVRVNVVGLFSDKAVLVINGGKPQTLHAGEISAEGVKLVTADSARAVLEIDGKRREVGLGQAAALPSAGGDAEPASVTLYADAQGHFITEGGINGKPVKMLVDTGASTVAMSSAQAAKLGLDYSRGESGLVSTAGGKVKAHAVSLNSVKIGGVVLHQVDAVVIEGNSPAVVLLGMSALNRLQMKHDGIALTLTKKF